MHKDERERAGLQDEEGRRGGDEGDEEGVQEDGSHPSHLPEEKMIDNHP